ncbi:homoserine dehydrogenase [Streptococcus castoreus]|uniref:homoserine dehydrogenase n=1 Tax=Streptococcus castoreus TaxID=254786 RepID=UPI0003F92CDA|nr:homoserine dehydrogenase [Streptococcus castoreus]
MVVRIALLGFGTVATGLPFLLTNNTAKIRSAVGDDIEIAKILVKDGATKEHLHHQGYAYNFVTSIDDIIEDDSIAIVVELMGRIEPAKTYLSRALVAGKHVVTANKDLVALHGKDLLTLAAKQGLAFYYEAAVAGGIPILRSLAHSFSADKITSLYGILNGTSNFMLTKMGDDGWTYEAALAKAQELGYAENDPTNDVEGIDAAYKLAILSQFAFGMSLDFETITHKGISSISPEDVATADHLGYVIKLVGSIREWQSGIYAEVIPTLLPKTHQLAGVTNVMNAVYVESLGIGETMFYGPGAGQMPTATSVLANLIEIGSRLTAKLPMAPFNSFTVKTRLAKPEDIYGSYYLALKCSNDSGVQAELQNLFDTGKAIQKMHEFPLENHRQCLVIVTKQMSKVAFEAFSRQLSARTDVIILNRFNVLGD